MSVRGIPTYRVYRLSDNNNYISVTKYKVRQKPTPAYESQKILYYLLVMAHRSINILYTAQEAGLKNIWNCK